LSVRSEIVGNTWQLLERNSYHKLSELPFVKAIKEWCGVICCILKVFAPAMY